MAIAFFISYGKNVVKQHAMQDFAAILTHKPDS